VFQVCNFIDSLYKSQAHPWTATHRDLPGRLLSSCVAGPIVGRTRKFVDENLRISIERINPDALHRPPGYHHVTIAAADRLVFLAGQCPVRRDGDLPDENDLAEQVQVTVNNSMIALAAAGATLVMLSAQWSMLSVPTMKCCRGCGRTC
jgi:enamine deaminase RidA (YjgF/YER057c/UK114 family)